MIDFMKYVPWLAMAAASFALPLALLMIAVIFLSVTSLWLGSQRQQHAVAVLDRLIELAKVIRFGRSEQGTRRPGPQVQNRSSQRISCDLTTTPEWTNDGV